MRIRNRIVKEYSPKCRCNIAGVDDALIAAGITALGSVAGAGISGAAQGKLNKETMKFNAEEAQKARDYSSEMWEKQALWNEGFWNKQNEYNSPSAQYQRLLDAGLNPMYYGLDGTGNADGMSAPQALGSPAASVAGLQNPLAGFSDIAMQMAQVANLQAQTNKTKSETKMIDAKLPYEVEGLKTQIRNSNLSADAQETVNKYIDRQQEAEIRMKNATAADAEKSVEKAVAEIDKMDYEKTTMYIGWLETQEKILTLQKNRELTDKQMQELDSLISVNSQTAAKLGLDVSNYDDITVIGTASQTMKIGPFSVQEGEPITLGMKKAAEEHKRQLKAKQDEENKKKKVDNNGQVSLKSGYDGPVYD